MSKNTEELLKMATTFEKLAFIKNASGFVDVLSNYDTAESIVNDFVESFKMYAYKGYEDGKGFPEETLNLILKQAELISDALGKVLPQLIEIDGEIYGTDRGI